MQVDCVIVGAGIAGLTCATRLHRAGLNVVVLEADCRIGGRIHTRTPAETGWPCPLELGAQWIHNAKTHHPIIQLARDSGLGTIPFDWGDTGCAHYVRGDGDVLPDDKVSITLAASRRAFARARARRPGHKSGSSSDSDDS